MARLTTSSVHIERIMTPISVAYKNEMYIGEQVFSTLPVMKMSDKYFVYTKADWFRDEAGPRAPGTIGPEAGFSVSSSAYSCQPISMTTVVADETIDNADQPLQVQISATEFVTEKVLISVERDVASLVFDSGAWAASATPATTWDNDSSQPLVNIETGYGTIVKAIGRAPNVCVMGYEVWTKLKNHPDLLDRIKHTQRGVMTTELLANLIGVPKVLVGTAIYDSAQEGATASYGFIWPKNMALLWVPPSPGLRVPAAGYTFTWKTRRMEINRRDEAKSFAYRCEQHYDTKVVATDAGYELIDVVT